eukprot:scaffold18865_cov55-Attheya_sp.AAC.2
MAPAVSKLAWDTTIKSSISAPSVVNPPILFFRPTSKEAPKTDLNKFDCHLDHADKDSDTFSITVHTFRHGTCEELLTWLKKFRTLERGLLIKTDKARFQIVRQILEGEGRRAFDNAAVSSILRKTVDLQAEERAEEKAGELATDVETTATTKIPEKKKSTLIVMGDVKEGPFEDAIKGLFKHFFPVDLSRSRKVYERLEELKELLPWFPPGFKASQKFDDTEISEIIESLAPTQWSGTLKVQNFDIKAHCSIELVEFLEWLETAE